MIRLARKKMTTKYKSPTKICAKWYLDKIRQIILEEDAKKKVTKKITKKR